MAGLSAHDDRNAQQRLAAGGDWVKSGLVFTSEDGTALDESNVRKKFKKMLMP